MIVLYFITIFLFLFLCTLLSLVILVQESKSLGLGASFGGDAGESLFGTSTATILKKFTAYLGAVFVIACVLLSIWSSSMGKVETIEPPQIEDLQGHG